MTDFSFLRLTLNDFALAKQSDNPNIATLLYTGFVQQLPNETFLQITNSPNNITFVGGISVDLVDGCNALVQNIDGNFFYEGFVDAKGVNQIAFEFGNIGVDYYTKPLYLKITDVLNGNIWYSNSFIVTNLNKNISSRFDYYNQTNIYNISYDLAPYRQSIRIANVYDQSPVNKRDVKQYVNSNGQQINYRTITTFLRQYNIEQLDYFINDRLEVLFSHQYVYLNNTRVVVSDFSVKDRKGDTNLVGGEFVINPQNETFIFDYQIYEELEVISRTPAHQSTATSFNGLISLTFNKPITTLGNAAIFKNGISIGSYSISSTLNVASINASDYAFGIGEYSIVIPNNAVVDFEGYLFNEWTFTIAAGQYSNTDYSNDYLIN